MLGKEPIFAIAAGAVVLVVYEESTGLFGESDGPLLQADCPGLLPGGDFGLYSVARCQRSRSLCACGDGCDIAATNALNDTTAPAANSLWSIAAISSVANANWRAGRRRPTPCA